MLAASLPLRLSSFPAQCIALVASRLLGMWTVLLWLRLALASTCCQLRVSRRHTPALVCLYTHSRVSLGTTTS